MRTGPSFVVVCDVTHDDRRTARARTESDRCMTPFCSVPVGYVARFCPASLVERPKPFGGLLGRDVALRLGKEFVAHHGLRSVADRRSGG